MESVVMSAQDYLTIVNSTEVNIIAWSVVLLLVQIILQAVSTYDLGPYLLGPRDDNRQSSNVMAGRLKRALENLLETYPAFIALALTLVVTSKTGGLGSIGALIWFWARIVYVPLYAFGVPAVRTLVWCVSFVGLLMMLYRLLA